MIDRRLSSNNTILVAIFLLTILGWGSGCSPMGWDVYSGPPSEARIHKEMEGLERTDVP
jgi:hypothetical protein